MSPALFIAVEVDEPVGERPGLAAKLDEVCPVDIFRATDRGVEIVEENLDECVLCELCINAAPAGHRPRDQAVLGPDTARFVLGLSARVGRPRQPLPAAAVSGR